MFVGRERCNYRYVNARAKQLAHYLCDLSIGKESVIGKCSNPNVNMIIGVLAILQVRAACIPIGPNNASQRTSTSHNLIR